MFKPFQKCDSSSSLWWCKLRRPPPSITVSYAEMATPSISPSNPTLSVESHAHNSLVFFSWYRFVRLHLSTNPKCNFFIFYISCFDFFFFFLKFSNPTVLLSTEFNFWFGFTFNFPITLIKIKGNKENQNWNWFWNFVKVMEKRKSKLKLKVFLIWFHLQFPITLINTRKIYCFSIHFF